MWYGDHGTSLRRYAVCLRSRFLQDYYYYCYFLDQVLQSFVLLTVVCLCRRRFFFKREVFNNNKSQKIFPFLCPQKSCPILFSQIWTKIRERERKIKMSRLSENNEEKDSRKTTHSKTSSSLHKETYFLSTCVFNLSFSNLTSLIFNTGNYPLDSA